MVWDIFGVQVPDIADVDENAGVIGPEGSGGKLVVLGSEGAGSPKRLEASAKAADTSEQVHVPEGLYHTSLLHPFRLTSHQGIRQRWRS